VCLDSGINGRAIKGFGRRKSMATTDKESRKPTGSGRARSPRANRSGKSSKANAGPGVSRGKGIWPMAAFTDESTVSVANSKSARKVHKLLAELHNKRSLLILMQDNPDPDSIAAAAALRRLANSLGEVQCSIAYGGVIGRSENRAVMDYLGLNFRGCDQVDPTKYDAIALVDTQPSAGNNSLSEDVLPDIVLDHHPLRPETRSVPFTDVRSKYGAVSTILFEYLREAEIVPDPPLATALLYAIRTDTQDLGLEAVRADVEALLALYPLANKKMLSAIQRRSVRPEYFQTLALALKNAGVYRNCIISELGELNNPDMIGEVADILVRHEAIDWVLCSGANNAKVWLSVRTTQTEAAAGALMQSVVKKIGTGGGHEQSAGGQVRLTKGTKAELESVQKTVNERFLRGTGAGDERRRPLVSL
jgi:nanoRNase/pAp phosphatase (c-di-AMP/oligoRNAs hydrolase)